MKCQKHGEPKTCPICGDQLQPNTKWSIGRIYLILIAVAAIAGFAALYYVSRFF